ncbi:TlyA family RNA methyltransferase, partial [Deltaproteobacteria bacterium OttesenSCG-928-M10]|nr:TlyA family RNA methyltransferase [Deltaproteobacteria bacterium OttesenSCG-928-M10]
LEGALADLQVDPAGLAALDIGASTGGFTDCLLQSGAASVTAVDVGRNLIDESLRRDRRVTVVEGVNARALAGHLPGAAFDLAVIDVSFISLALILPQAARLVKPEGRILAMVKPQFEVGREKVGKKGVVRDPAAIVEAVNKISALGSELTPAFAELGRAPSRLLGPEGNQEIFILFQSINRPPNDNL